MDGKASTDDELTGSKQSYQVSSPTTQPFLHQADSRDSISAFSFPPLSSDGSLQDLRDLHNSSTPPTSPKSTTPPAALSSLGAKAAMVSTRMDDSVQSLSEGQYDMLDDVSEISNDDRETASLPSTPTEGSDDEEEEDTVVVPQPGLEEGIENSISVAPELGVESQLLSSQLSDSMDTPRQSMLRPTILHHPNEASYSSRSTTELRKEKLMETLKLRKELIEKSDRLIAARRQEASYRTHARLSDPDAHLSTPGASLSTPVSKQKAMFNIKDILLLVSVTLLLGIGIWQNMFSGFTFSRRDSGVDLASRKSAVQSNLHAVTGSNQALESLNLDHLLGSPHTWTEPVRSQAVSGNQIVFSLRKGVGNHGYPYVTNMKMSSANGKSIRHTLVNVVDGVYLLTAANDQLCGGAFFELLTENPFMNVSGSHDVDYSGSCGASRSTDLVKSAAKELIVIRNATMAWMKPISGPLNAGLKATQNMTTELATYVRRDIQVFNANALSFLTKAAATTNHTVSSVLNKEVMIVLQKDLMVWTGNMTKSISTAAAQSLKNLTPRSNIKRSLLDSLARSGSHAKNLGRRLKKSKDAATATTRDMMSTTHDRINLLAAKMAKRRDEKKALREAKRQISRKKGEDRNAAPRSAERVVAEARAKAKKAAKTAKANARSKKTERQVERAIGKMKGHAERRAKEGKKTKARSDDRFQQVQLHDE